MSDKYSDWVSKMVSMASATVLSYSICYKFKIKYFKSLKCTLSEEYDKLVNNK